MRTAATAFLTIYGWYCLYLLCVALFWEKTEMTEEIFPNLSLDTVRIPHSKAKVFYLYMIDFAKFT